MTISHFIQDKFEYNFQINNKIIDLLASLGTEAPKNTLKWMSHIFNAQDIWNNRIGGNPAHFKVWQIHPIPEWRHINQSLHDQSIVILSEMDLSQIISYNNSEGIHFENNCSDILFHIVNHSTYHRGQIAIELREKGFEPIGTDFIFYKR